MRRNIPQCSNPQRIRTRILLPIAACCAILLHLALMTVGHGSQVLAGAHESEHVTAAQAGKLLSHTGHLTTRALHGAAHEPDHPPVPCDGEDGCPHLTDCTGQAFRLVKELRTEPGHASPAMLPSPHHTMQPAPADGIASSRGSPGRDVLTRFQTLLI